MTAFRPRSEACAPYPSKRSLTPPLGPAELLNRPLQMQGDLGPGDGTSRVCELSVGVGREHLSYCHEALGRTMNLPVSDSEKRKQRRLTT